MTRLIAITLFLIFHSINSSFSQYENKNFIQGVELTESKKYSEALVELLKAKEILSNSGDKKALAEVIWYEAKCYTHQYEMDKALTSYQEMTTIGIEINDPLIEARGLNAEAVLFRFKGDYSSVISHSRRILSLPLDDQQYNLLSDAHSILGDVYGNQFLIDSAITNYSKAIHIDTLNKDTNSMSFNFLALGNMYSIMGNNDKAIEIMVTGVNTLRPSKDDFKKSEFFQRLADLFLNEMNLDKAHDYADKAIDIAVTNNMELNLAYSQSLLAKVYIEESNLIGAENLLLESRNVFLDKNKKYAIISNGVTLSHLYLDQSRLKEAEESLNEVNLLIVEGDNNRNLANLYLTWCRLHISKKDYDKAELYLNKVTNSENYKKVPYLVYKTYIIEHSINKGKGEYKLALENLEKANEFKRGMDKKAQSYIVHELEAKYNKVEDEKQISALAAQSEIDAIKLNERNNLLYVSLSALLIVLIILFFIFKQNRIIKRMMGELKEKNELITKTLGEKDLLLREIHHRVKNNLQVVSSLLSIQSREIEDKNALEAISESRNRVKSMAIIHQNLYKDDNLTGINTKDYIEKLSKSLFNSYRIDNDRLELVNEVQELNLDVDTTIPLGLILNELITNALKYAFPNDRKGSIKVELKEDNNTLLLIVSDNGIGMKLKADNTESFGLKMIKTFAKKLNADYDIINNKGTTITMKIKKYKLAV